MDAGMVSSFVEQKRKGRSDPCTYLISCVSYIHMKSTYRHMKNTGGFNGRNRPDSVFYSV